MVLDRGFLLSLDQLLLSPSLLGALNFRVIDCGKGVGATFRDKGWLLGEQVRLWYV